MDSASGNMSDLKLVALPTTHTALFPSSEQPRGGYGAGAGPSPPRFNLPDSYWLQTRQDRTDRLHLEQANSTEWVARYLAVSAKSKSAIDLMIENLEADRENDPRSRTEGLASRVNLMQFQPARVELSAETIAGLIVLNDPGGDAAASTPVASSTATSTAAATQQDIAVSGCCLPPSCVIL